MLKMIIADDEEIVRRGLKNMVLWEALGIEIIAEAADGQEALELCQAHRPDILFTDIRMPIMDGLEVAMKLKELQLDIRVVLISGVQDFNYAKTALDINVEGYALKPVNLDELNEVIRKVVNRIKLERNQKSEIIQLKEQLREHMPIIREKFLRNLVLGIYSDGEQLEKKLRYFDIPLQMDESIIVSILQIDDFAETAGNISEEDKQLLNFSISNIIEEIIAGYNVGVGFWLYDDEFVLIFSQYANLNRKHTEICEEILSCLTKFLNISCSIGVGRSVGSVLSISTSYQDAHVALQYRFYTGNNSLLDINDINKMKDIRTDAAASFNLYENETHLMDFIKLGDKEGVSKTLDILFYSLCSDRNLPVDYIQSICVEIVCIASRTVQDLGEDLDRIIGNRSSILDALYRKGNSVDLKGYVKALFIKVAEYFSNKYNQKNNRIILRIREIIEQRYHEDISVAKISEEVYLTPNYISMIFKQEMKETISEYITKIRMEQAKNLLITTDLRILEIAEKVGYEDPHYFTKVFKKYTGTLPQKFRS